MPRTSRCACCTCQVCRPWLLRPIVPLLSGDDGTVWAWGDDSEGELGNRKETYTSELPVRVKGLHGIRQLAAGEFSGFALGQDGALWAWGDNSSGQLARNLSVGTSDVPTRVDDVGQVQGVAAGASTAYAVRKDGTVWAWGDNAFGELTRRGSRLIASEVPLEIEGIRGAAAVAAGADAGFALLRDGTVWAWGDGSFGDLGTRSLPGSPPDQLRRLLSPGAGWAPAPGTRHSGRDLRRLCPCGQRPGLVLGFWHLRPVG